MFGFPSTTRGIRANRKSAGTNNEMILKRHIPIVILALALGTAIAARSDDQPVRVALVGDSTMCDYAESRPDRGWGMFVEEAFRPGRVEVGNFARAGRSTKTFIEEKRWAKTLEWEPDYVFIQFGHNDSHASENPESTDAATDYREFLRRYIEDSRAIGATPILVTPMVRRTFHDDGALEDNLEPYAEAMKAVAKEEEAAVIDLHASSWQLVESLGPEGARQLANKPGDPTHFNEKGARAMRDLVLRELPAAAPELARHLAPESTTNP